MGSLRAEVGALIRRHRTGAGLTQAQFAERTGKSLELVGRIERGATAPSFDTLETFAATLSVPVREFFGSGDHSVSGNDALAKIIQRAATLPTEDVEWLDRLVAVALSRKARRQGPG